jgi:hypothetical protein
MAQYIIEHLAELSNDSSLLDCQPTACCLPVSPCDNLATNVQKTRFSGGIDGCFFRLSQRSPPCTRLRNECVGFSGVSFLRALTEFNLAASGL